MASLAEWGISNPSAPFGSAIGGLVPQYRLNETYPALQEDAGIATSRALQDYGTRNLPDLMNQGAAMGQWRSSGLRNRADRVTQDTGRQVIDIQRMLARNTANLPVQRVKALVGSYAGGEFL